MVTLEEKRAEDEPPEHIREAILGVLSGQPQTRERSGTRGRKPKGRGIHKPSYFEHARFEARLNKVEFTPSGEGRIVLIANEADGEQVAKLREAYAVGLDVIVEKRTYGGN